MRQAKNNWFVGLYDTNRLGVTALAETLGPDNCCSGQMDVTCPDSVRAGVSLFANKTGGELDLLFICAGVLFMGCHENITRENQKKTVDINLTGPLNLIHDCLPLLKATRKAAIINMSSASAVYGTPELAVYSATKHAIRGLTEALNIEFEPLDVHVSDIMVSFVATPMVTGATHRATSLQRLKAGITPQRVARVVFRAYHHRKVHWQIGGLLKVLIFSTHLLPFAKRILIKTIGFSKPAT
jgi:NAD(P)-dependent dehydrogenase (short-subunit alcohol dehydrogenase family)